MLRAIARAAVLAAILAVLGAGTGLAQTSAGVAVGAAVGPIDLSFFYQKLADDGEWFQSPNYGWAWTPYDVSADWRPYAQGHWEYTDDGWTWASDEPFGWATYHYGRWYQDPTYGWAWVPGTEWAPAWVAWRNTDDYVGWAPLPPDARWDDTAGLTFTSSDAIPYDEWSFVPQDHLLDADLSVDFAPVGRNVTLFQRSHDSTRFELRAGHPFDIGFDVGAVETRLGHPVPRATIHDADDFARGGGRDASNGAVNYYRPRVQGSVTATAPAPEIVNRSSSIPDADLQRMRDDRQKKLEADLTAERARMLSEQDRELKAQGAAAQAEALKKQHAAEQAAFDKHAAQERQVFQQRMQHRVVRPANGAAPGRPTNPGNGSSRGMGSDRGNGPDRTGH